jgi:hypothetical protein
MAWIDLRANGPTLRSSVVDPARPGASLEAMLEDFAPAGRQGRAGRLEVVVDDGLAHHWLQQPVAGVRSLAELRDAARARCAQLFGDAQALEIAGDWHLGRPFVCAALPRALVKELHHAAASRRTALRLGTLTAACLARGAGRLPAEGWFGLRSESSLTLGCTHGSRLTALRCLSADPADTPAQAETSANGHLRAELARQAQATAAPLTWIDLRALPLPAADAQRGGNEGNDGEDRETLAAGICAWTSLTLAGDLP